MIHKKKILFSTHIYGSMEALIDFYNANLSHKEKYKDIKIKVTGGLKLYNNNRTVHYLKRALALMGRYDLIISNRPTKLFIKGKKVIYISHGYGAKKTPGLDEIANSKKMRAYSFLRKNINYIITLSTRDEGYFLRCKSLEKYPLPKYLPLGLPRNDILFNKNFINSSKKEISEKYNIGNNKIMLYAPTWRGYKTTGKPPFFKKDFEKLNEYLEKTNWKFLYRPHYIESIIDEQLISGIKNIIKVDFDAEPYTQKLLAASDLLITDYSSIYVDFLILNKPIVFIPFDYEKYTNYRGLVIDFRDKSDTPGEKVLNISELISYLKELENGNDEYISWRSLARKKFYNYFDGKSCYRIWNFITKILNE